MMTLRQSFGDRRKRRGRISGDILAVLPLLVVTAIVLVGIYVGQAMRNPIVDWVDLSVVSVSLGLTPGVIGSALALLREHQVPVTAALSVTFVAVAAVIAALSASRLFISYFGVLLCLPFLVLTMVLVALRLQRRMNENVAILDFPGLGAVRALLGSGLKVIRKGEMPDHDVERVLIDVDAHHSAEWSPVLVKCYVRDIDVTPWITFLELRQGRVDLGHFDLADVMHTPGQLLYLKAKRLLDLLFTAILFPLLVPVGLVTWAYVWMRLRRDTIFTQPRRGLGGSTFNIYKLRTMRARADGPLSLEVVPGLGLVRRFRLDELPQLWNIILGNMSWVGPRPVTLAVAEAAELTEPKYAARQVIRPGLSGWAQINSGHAGSTAEELDKLAFDLFYIKRVSLDLDVQIFFRTISVVLFGKGK
jgi:lipopolysaccharide/colanic/teichoic acid biosynthesis glycosyltransferase